FAIRAENVLIDLLTDSGTSAMSSKQWAAMMDGDESYAGAKSFFRFESMVKRITGKEFIIPTHQGRAAEKILFSIVGGKGKYVPNNSHFDTTRANVEYSGAEAVDLLNETGKKPEVRADFKGNMDIEALENFIQKVGKENIPLVMVTITNNSGGGQPVSMQNIKDIRKVCDKYGLPFFFDACRFAENAYFIKKREKGYDNKSIEEICKEMFSYCDGATMSAKKDGLVNIGGFLALNDDKLATECKNLLIITEGFPTYGGLAGRDLDAIAVGLEEVMEESYLDYRIGTTSYLGNRLLEVGIPIIEPPGGHAIYVDAKRMLPDISQDKFPGQSIVCELYIEAGIRAVEIGSVMFGKKDQKTGEFIPAVMELVRLAIPRRVYTRSHMDYIVEAMENVSNRKDKIPGYELTYETPFLRHFTAQFKSIK
ncbi:tryptophanase, partial [Bacteroidota bacterium]